MAHARIARFERIHEPPAARDVAGSQQFLDEDAQAILVAGVGCEVERRAAFGVGRVGPGARGDQLLRGAPIAEEGGAVQGRRAVFITHGVDARRGKADGAEESREQIAVVVAPHARDEVQRGAAVARLDHVDRGVTARGER